MTNYTIWADLGTGDKKIYEIGKHLKKCSGGTIKVLGIGPNVGQSYGLHNGKGTVGVFMTNGVGLATPNDFELGCKPGGYYKYERTIFVWPQWIGNQWMSNKNIQKHKIPGEWDWNRSSSYNVGGQTATQWFPKAKYVDLVAGTSPQDIAQRICNGAYVTEDGNPGSPTSSSSGSGSGYGGSSSGSGSSSSGVGSSDVSPLLQGEMSFEELIGSICNGIDLLFLPKRTTVVVDDFESIYAEAKYLRDYHSKVVEGENIKLWQLEEDSYEMEVNQHGFYNTVYVKYRNGTVREAYDDYVRVFGEIPITYKEPKADKTTAQMKAKAYLAAHVRDFNMSINLSMLTEGDIDIGDIVTVNNPKTYNNDRRIGKGLDPEYLFVNGISTNWEGDTLLLSDLELKLAPVSPEAADVPFSGVATGVNKSSSLSNANNPSIKSGLTFNSCGVSSDKDLLMSICRPSGGRSGKYNYNTWYRTIFENKCPRCGKKGVLRWDSGTVQTHCITCGGYSGSKRTWGDISEGEVSCNGCCSDFDGVTGWEKDGNFSSRLTYSQKPIKSSKKEFNALLRGGFSI